MQNKPPYTRSPSFSLWESRSHADKFSTLFRPGVTRFHARNIISTQSHTFSTRSLATPRILHIPRYLYCKWKYEAPVYFIQVRLNMCVEWSSQPCYFYLHKRLILSATKFMFPESITQANRCEFVWQLIRYSIGHNLIKPGLQFSLKISFGILELND